MHLEYNKMNFNRPWTRDFQHDKGETIYIQFLQALSEQKTENSSAADNVLIEAHSPDRIPNEVPEKRVRIKQIERPHNDTEAQEHGSLAISIGLFLFWNEIIIMDDLNNLFNHLQ